MPLLRARELRFVLEKAGVSIALCDARFTGDLTTATETRRFATGFAQPYDVIMRADGKYLFVVNQNTGATTKYGEILLSFTGFSEDSDAAAS